MKERLRSVLPNSVFRVLSYVNVYRKRIFTWFTLIVCIKGATLTDQIKLLLSFLVGIFTSFKNLSEWQDPQLLWYAKLEVKNIGKFYVRNKTDDLHHINPYRESEVYYEIKNVLKRDDLFVDVGANIGFYTVLASKIVGKNGKVYSIEMLPANNRILNEHVRVNNLNNVEIIKKALSNNEGDEITISTPYEQFGQASIVYNEIGSGNKITVKTVRLDQIIGENEKITLLKIDTEGAEKLVLEGAEKIVNNIRRIIFEMHDDDPFKNTVFKFLRNKGFDISKLGGKDYLATNRSALNNE